MQFAANLTIWDSVVYLWFIFFTFTLNLKGSYKNLALWACGREKGAAMEAKLGQNTKFVEVDVDNKYSLEAALNGVEIFYCTCLLMFMSMSVNRYGVYQLLSLQIKILEIDHHVSVPFVFECLWFYLCHSFKGSNF